MRMPALAVLLSLASLVARAEPTRSPEEIRAAVERCASARETVPGVSPADQANRVIEGCRDLFAKAGCRDAWSRSLNAHPSEKISTIIEGCRKAYCPSLPAPKPRLCSGKNGDLKSYHQDFLDFEKVVLLRDLGPEFRKQIEAWFPLAPEMNLAPIVVSKPDAGP